MSEGRGKVPKPFRQPFLAIIALWHAFLHNGGGWESLNAKIQMTHSWLVNENVSLIYTWVHTIFKKWRSINLPLWPSSTIYDERVVGHIPLTLTFSFVLSSFPLSLSRFPSRLPFCFLFYQHAPWAKLCYDWWKFFRLRVSFTQGVIHQQ